MIRQSIIERLTREKSEPTEYTLEFLSTADLYCSLLDFVTNVFPETVKIDQRGALCGDIQISCRGLAFFFRLVISAAVTSEKTDVTLIADEKLIRIVINYKDEALDTESLSRVAKNSGLALVKDEDGEIEFSIKVIPNLAYKIYALDRKYFLSFLHEAVFL